MPQKCKKQAEAEGNFCNKPKNIYNTTQLIGYCIPLWRLTQLCSIATRE